MKRSAHNEQGYMLLIVLFIMAIGMAISASMMKSSSTATKTRALVKTHADYNYECEETLNKTVTWLQENSTALVDAFTSSNFSANFDLDAQPTVGANEGQHFEVPTMIKMAGSNNSVMLSNNSFFGYSAFPSVTDLSDNSSFDAVSAFQAADLGKANARAIVMWARESDGDYAPIFRVDAVTGNNPDRGAHMFTYVYSQLVIDPSGGGGGIAGFYTEDGDLETKTGNNTCDSYIWSWDGAAWSKGAPRSNCVVASKKVVKLESRISGEAQAYLDVLVLSPNGEVSGDICENNANCHDMDINPYDDWSVTCGGHSQGNLTVSSNLDLPSGPNLSDQCWEEVYIKSNKTLTLIDTDNPYRFKTLKYQNGSNSVMAIPTMGPNPDSTLPDVELYVDNFDGGQLNGNMMYNANNAPSQLKIYVTSGSSFKLNGTAVMHGYFIAPEADVQVLGNFNFHGAIHSSQLEVTGNATFNYDEGIGGSGPAVADMTFSLNKASQRYR